MIVNNAFNYFNDYRVLPPLPNIPVTVFIAYNSPSSPQQDAMLAQLNLNLTSTFFTELNKIRIDDYLKFIENSSKGAVICLPKFKHFMHLQDPKVIAKALGQ